MASANILHMTLTGNGGTINLNHAIPAQPLTLQYVRVEMDTAANAASNPIISIDLASVFGPSQINNSNQTNSRLPVFTTSDGTTSPINQYTPNLEIGLQQDVVRSFEYDIYGTNGDLITASQLVRVDLIFGYGFGTISGG